MQKIQAEHGDFWDDFQGEWFWSNIFFCQVWLVFIHLTPVRREIEPQAYNSHQIVSANKPCKTQVAEGCPVLSWIMLRSSQNTPWLGEGQVEINGRWIIRIPFLCLMKESLYKWVWVFPPVWKLQVSASVFWWARYVYMPCFETILGVA